MAMKWRQRGRNWAQLQIELLSSVRFRTKMVNSTVREFGQFPLGPGCCEFKGPCFCLCIWFFSEFVSAQRRRTKIEVVEYVGTEAELININWEAERPLSCVLCTHWLRTPSMSTAAKAGRATSSDGGPYREREVQTGSRLNSYSAMKVLPFTQDFLLKIFGATV